MNRISQAALSSGCLPGVGVSELIPKNPAWVFLFWIFPNVSLLVRFLFPSADAEKANVSKEPAALPVSPWRLAQADKEPHISEPWLFSRVRLMLGIALAKEE